MHLFLLWTHSAESFRPHMDKLERTISWIESHQLVEVVSEYCDPISGHCYGRTVRGWASSHLQTSKSEGGPRAYSTAQTKKGKFHEQMNRF